MSKNIPLPPADKIPPPPVPLVKNETSKSRIVTVYKDARIPPQAVDLEEAVLGALLNFPKAIEEVINYLGPEVFYKDIHQIIYRAILSLHSKNIGIDVLTVSMELKDNNQLVIIGGDFYLIGLCQTVTSQAHLEFHSHIIIQKYILREYIRLSSDVIEKSYKDDGVDIFDLYDTIEQRLLALSNRYFKRKNNVEVSDPTNELFEKMKAIERGEKPGLYTGISEFDEFSGGFQKRELIVIGARTSMGKTTCGLSIAYNITFGNGLDASFFTLEMTRTDFYQRIASRITNIPYSRIREGKISVDEFNIIQNVYKTIDKSKLHIVDNITIHEKICAKIREHVELYGVKIVFIDYVQLMKLMKKTTDKTGDLTLITRDLKALANELNIPIVIFAQVSRNVDGRSSKIPNLSDLKQSGSIEEDADTVIFLHREAAYTEKTSVGLKMPISEIGRTKFIVAKGRNIGTALFETFLDFLKFSMYSFSEYKNNE